MKKYPDTMTKSLPVDECLKAAAVLNKEYLAVSLDREVLQRLLHNGNHSYQEIVQTRPYLFADNRVFVGKKCLARMAAVVAAVERVVALPAYQKRVLGYAPSIAHSPLPKARSVFMGYDFHLDEEGPKLIEINTNAGGALLNAKLVQAQIACSGDIASLLPNATLVEHEFVAMFKKEWRYVRGDRPLETIAIIDTKPSEQYLAPEFELFRELFIAHGIQAWVLDPSELVFNNHSLEYQGKKIDLVYNRLTDFYLEEPAHASLKVAYEAESVVLTPHPHAHALYANKRNLIIFSDPDTLRELGVEKSDIELLIGCIPVTKELTPENAADFWKSRRQWFFKPATGFGSRAAYRGEKLTRQVFANISTGNYIAQAMVIPSERYIISDEKSQRILKFDLRNYTYEDQVQLVAARLYQGQTTNFRTPSGGFAAVFTMPCTERL